MAKYQPKKKKLVRPSDYIIRNWIRWCKETNFNDAYSAAAMRFNITRKMALNIWLAGNPAPYRKVSWKE